MICTDAEAFAALLPRDGAIAGLDLGTVTIGVAVSDRRRRVATPLETVKRTKFTLDAQRLLEIAKARDLKGFVLGLPINMDGSEGLRAQSSRAFGRNLLRLQDIPIAFWDERLSSAAVNRMMIEEMDMTRARRAEVVDKLAAAYILQGALDRLGTG